MKVFWVIYFIGVVFNIYWFCRGAKQSKEKLVTITTPEELQSVEEDIKELKPKTLIQQFWIRVLFVIGSFFSWIIGTVVVTSYGCRKGWFGTVGKVGK